MGAIPPIVGPPGPRHRPRGRRRRIAGRAVRHTWRFFLVWTGAGLVFALVFAGVLAFALADGPVALPSWVTARIEAQLNRGLPAGRVSLSRIEVGLGGGLSRVRLRDVGIYDDSGAEVARLNEVGGAFSLPGLIRGEILPRTLRLSGAQMTVRRRVDGSFDLSFGRMGGLAGSLPAILDRVDGLFASGPLSSVERIEASELTVTLEDARSGRIWQVTDGRVTLTQDAAELRLDVESDVFNGTEELAGVSATIRSRKGSLEASMEAAVRNARSGDIALQSPALSFLSVIDAPVGGAVQVSVDGEGRVAQLTAQLSVGEGLFSPGGPLDMPVRIGSGEMRLGFDPARQRIAFERLRLRTDRAELDMSGQSFLRDLQPGGWPGHFVGQFTVNRIALGDTGWLAGPVAFTGGLAEVKLALRPFRLDIGRLVLGEGEEAIAVSGRVAVSAQGPDLSLSAEAGRLSRDRLLALWPPAVAPGPRGWVMANVAGGELRDAKAALVRAPGEARPRLALGFGFDGAEVRYLKGLPPVRDAAGYATLAENRFYVRADRGTVTAPEGGEVDVAGSAFSVADTRARPPEGRVDLAASGPLTAMLSLLDQEPIRAMAKAGQPVDLAGGRAVARAEITLPLKHGLEPAEIAYAARGELLDLSSEVLVPGRRAEADHMAFETDGRTLSIRGPARLDGLPVEVAFTTGLDPGAGPARVEAQVTLDQAFLDAFGIALPKGMVAGAGRGTVGIDLPRGGTPVFRLTSDLRGLDLRLDAVGWRKGAKARGRLEVSGTLASPPTIDRVELEGGGLRTSGRVVLTPEGGFAGAQLDRVRLNGWLDAPVTLTGRGAATPAVAVRGGTLDFRSADFGGGGAGSGSGGPVTVALDRLIVTEGVELRGFRGEFSTQRGFQGSFTARLNGGGQLTGTVQPQNGGTALRVTSANAGAILKDAGVAQNIRGGAMELVLVPTDRAGIYEGRLSAETIRVRGMPALAGLINAVSVVGLLQQLNGDGIVFDQVSARFLLTPNAINFTRASAVGASMGISAQGSYLLGSGELNMRGVFSPMFLLNGIGQIFTRSGEGLFGFNYRVGGTAADPQVSVNPLSILTPGMFREIFEAEPPRIR